MKDQFRVDIPLDSPIRKLKGRLKDENVIILLQCRVKALIGRYVADKQECFLNSKLILKVDSKPLKIEFPSQLPNGQIDILAIDESIVIADFLHYLPVAALNTFSLCRIKSSFEGQSCGLSGK